MFLPGLGAFLHTCVQYHVQTWGEHPGKIPGQCCVPLSCGCAPSQAANELVTSFSLTIVLAEQCNGHFKMWVTFLISVLGILSLWGWPTTVTGCPDRWWSLHPRDGHEHDLGELGLGGAAWPGIGQDDFQNPSILNGAVILWNTESVII